MSSRANGVATGRSADLTNAGHVTQIEEVLRSEPDWHIAQDDNLWDLVPEDRSYARSVLNTSTHFGQQLVSSHLFAFSDKERLMGRDKLVPPFADFVYFAGPIPCVISLSHRACN